MSSITELDLRGVLLPVSLLECNRALLQLESHESLEVLIRDPEAVASLIQIVERSQDRVVQSRREGDYHRIHIGPISDHRSHGSKGKGVLQQGQES